MLPSGHASDCPVDEKRLMHPAGTAPGASCDGHDSAPWRKICPTSVLLRLCQGVESWVPSLQKTWQCPCLAQPPPGMAGHPAPMGTASVLHSSDCSKTRATDPCVVPPQGSLHTQTPPAWGRRGTVHLTWLVQGGGDGDAEAHGATTASPTM